MYETLVYNSKEEKKDTQGTKPERDHVTFVPFSEAALVNIKFCLGFAISNGDGNKLVEPLEDVDYNEPNRCWCCHNYNCNLTILGQSDKE